MYNDVIKGKMELYFLSNGFQEHKRGWLTGTCPECGEDRKGKYAVHIDDDRGNCFICGNKDKPFKVIRTLENLKTNQEVYNLLSKYDGSYYKSSSRAEKRDYKKLELPESFKLIGIDNNKYAQIVEKNLRSRGFSISRLQMAGVGYCTKGEYAHRIVIPYYSEGELIYFNARRLTASGTKFKNPKADEFGIGKTQIIYNRDALYIYSKIYIFESATNALTLGSNATATGGKILSQWQISKYIESPANTIIIGLDDDAILEAYKLAMQLCPYKRVKVLEFPKGQDANKLGRKATKKLEKETPFGDYKYFYSKYLEKRAINSY